MNRKQPCGACASWVISVFIAALTVVLGLLWWCRDLPYKHVAAGATVTVVFGFFASVGLACLLYSIMGKDIKAPTDDAEPLMSNRRAVFWKTSGCWVGLFERPIFFAAFLFSGGWALLSAWFVLKTAVYWQGSNFTKYPETSPTRKDAEYIAALHRLGRYHATVALVGTSANVVFGLIGVSVAAVLERWCVAFC
jgi:hypothetical protein